VRLALAVVGIVGVVVAEGAQEEQDWHCWWRRAEEG